MDKIYVFRKWQPSRWTPLQDWKGMLADAETWRDDGSSTTSPSACDSSKALADAIAIVKARSNPSPQSLADAIALVKAKTQGNGSASSQKEPGPLAKKKAEKKSATLPFEVGSFEFWGLDVCFWCRKDRPKHVYYPDPWEVLQTLVKMPCPPPVVATQEEPEAKPGKKKKGKRAKSQGGKPKSDAASKPQSKTEVASLLDMTQETIEFKYEPGMYRKHFVDFVKSEKENKGLTHKEALESWHGSKLKARLLEGMPSPEKRKRRFQ